MMRDVECLPARAEELDAPHGAEESGTEEVEVSGETDTAEADNLNAPSATDANGTDEIEVPAAGETASTTRTFVGGGPNSKRGRLTDRGLLP